MNLRKDRGVPSPLSPYSGTILKMDANDKQMPPTIASVAVRVNYTTPECGEDSTSTRLGAADTNSSSIIIINSAPISDSSPAAVAVTKLEKLFHPSNVSPRRLGLAEGQEAVKPPAGSFVYSGVHDDGPLPPPREGGVMAQLISCVQEAKTFNDTYLTEIIEQEKLAAKRE